MIRASTSARSTRGSGRPRIHRGPLWTCRPDCPRGSGRTSHRRSSRPGVSRRTARTREPSIPSVPSEPSRPGRTRGTLTARPALQAGRTSISGRTCVRRDADRAGVTSHTGRPRRPGITREPCVTRATTDTGGASSAGRPNHSLGLGYPPYVDNRHGITLLASSSHRNTPAHRTNCRRRTPPQTYSCSRPTHMQGRQPQTPPD